MPPGKVADKRRRLRDALSFGHPHLARVQVHDSDFPTVRTYVPLSVLEHGHASSPVLQLGKKPRGDACTNRGGSCTLREPPRGAQASIWYKGVPRWGQALATSCSVALVRPPRRGGAPHPPRWRSSAGLSA